MEMKDNDLVEIRYFLTKAFEKMAEYEESKIKPCPCCGFTDIKKYYGAIHTYEIERGNILPSGPYQLKCNKCGIQTPWSDKAIKIWNTRTQE